MNAYSVDVSITSLSCALAQPNCEVYCARLDRLLRDSVGSLPYLTKASLLVVEGHALGAAPALMFTQM